MGNEKSYLSSSFEMQQAFLKIKYSIGFAIAKKLGQEGAHVVVSSRSEKNVDRAVESLRNDGVSVKGLVCHVGKQEHRSKLLEEVYLKYFYMKVYCL